MIACRVPGVLCLISASAACTPAAPIFLDLETAPELSVLFAVDVAAPGQILHRAGPLFLESDTPAQTTRFMSEAGAEAWLIGLSHAQIAELSPWYDPGRASELQLLARTEDVCIGGSAGPQGQTSVHPLPEPAFLWRAEDDQLVFKAPAEAPFLIASPLAISLPLDHEACIEPGFRTLSAFADRDVPIPVGLQLPERTLIQESLLYREVYRLRDERAILLAGGGLVLLERGQAFQPLTSRFISLPAVTVSMVVDEHPTRYGGRVRVVVFGFPDEDRSMGIWHEAEIDQDGITYLESTLVDEPVGAAVLEPSTGRVVVAGEGGSIYLIEQRGEHQVFADRFDATDADMRLAFTGWPEEPFALTGGQRSQVLFGAPDASTWTLAPTTGLGLEHEFREIASVPAPDGRRLYVGANTGELYWYDRPDRRWIPAETPVPQNYECGAVDECGVRVQAQSIRGIAGFERSGTHGLYIVVNDCIAVLEVRQDGRCGGVIPMPGREGLRARLISLETEVFTPNVRALHVSESGWLTVASQEGGVYELWTGGPRP